MRVTLSSEDGRVATLDVSADQKLGDLHVLVEVELGILVDEQSLIHNGVPLSNPEATLSSLGVREDDLVLVVRQAPARRTGSAGAAPGGAAAGGAGGRRRGGLGAGLRAPRTVQIDPALYPAMTWADLPDGVSPDTLHAILQVNSGMMSEISKRDPEMMAAATAPTPALLRTLILKRTLAHAAPEAERAARMSALEARIAANPYDVDAQRQLEEFIAEKNVEENWRMAMEHMPEAFARVFMLYVPAKINGTFVKVFVDSGAQTTILSKRCAERCGIMRLVDKHFAGTAVGVGTAKLFGRVHMAPLELGGNHFPCTFTVMDSDGVECLLGLDMLKRYQAVIDLGSNHLRMRLGGAEVTIPFLGEADIPKNELGGPEYKDKDKEGKDKETAASGGAGSSSSGGGSAGGAAATATSSSGGAMGGAGAATGGAGAAASPAPGPSPAPAAASSGSASNGMAVDGHATSGPAAPLPSASASASSAAGSAASSASSLFATLDLSSLRPARLASAAPRAVASAGPGRGVATAAPGPAALAPAAAASAGSAAASAGSSAGAGGGGGGAAGGVDESSVAMLTALGFPRAKVITALQLAAGNVEAAAGLLPDL